jgi:hypothetical protein
VKSLALVVVLLCLPVVGAGEEAEPISTDRAGASTGTATVGTGAFQLETGVSYFHARVAGSAPDRRFQVEAGLRGGVTERLELRIEGRPIVWLRGEADATDVGDFLVSVKYRFADAPEGSWVPSLGVLPFVKLPVAEEPIGSGKTDFGALLLASFALPARLSLDVNAGLNTVGQNRPGGYRLQALAAAGLGFEIGEPVTLFTEVVYASRGARLDSADNVLVDAGVVWRASRNVAVDASVLTSLLGAGPDWGIRTGVSVRFGR